MAVAAYASLVSLTHVLDNIHNRAQLQSPPLDIGLIETLQERVHFLLDFVESHSLRTEGIEELFKKLAKVAFEAEDLIDFHVVNELCGGSQEDIIRYVGYTTFCQDMQKVIEKTDFIKAEIQENITEERSEDVRARKQPRVLVPAGGSSATTGSGGKSHVVVGFDRHVEKISDVLTRGQSNLQILPIIGAGGIGKTTLAKVIFEHSLIRDRFDICIWVTISEEYNIRQILRDLLNDQEEEDNGASVGELGTRLHQELFGRRYFIVMDDVWDTDIWDYLKRFFPDTGNGSWIMMTTRLLNVGDYAGGSGNSYLIDFLNNDESWNLLCQKVFERNECPLIALEKIGKTIAEGCRGLPLLINVISGLLAKSTMTEEEWGIIAQNVNSLDNLEDNEYCLRSLSLSYDNLPIYLKPCFLYMRVYAEDAEIDVFKLIQLWIAEGLLKLQSDKCLEEIGREHVKDLIDRNLIFIRNKTIGGDQVPCLPGIT